MTALSDTLGKQSEGPDVRNPPLTFGSFRIVALAFIKAVNDPVITTFVGAR